MLSESDNKLREKDNAITVCEVFQYLDSDNQLLYKKLKTKKLDLTSYKIPGADTIKIQPREGQNLISLPARELLEEFKNKEHTNILQTEVPILLQSGYIKLGVNEYKGSEVTAYLRDNYDQGNFPLVLIGEQGSGKTTLISNYIDLIKAMDEGKIVLIKMSQEYFVTPYSKNVIVTYGITKVWCATLVRGDRQKQPKRFHIIVDEIFQAKTSMQMLKEQEILPQYSSLNLINYEEGRAKFITKLPKPL